LTLDSNIVIYYLNGDPEVLIALDRWKGAKVELCVSSITVAEVLSQGTLTREMEGVILKFLESLTSVPFDDQVAHIAAMVRRVYGLKLPDAAIAATALSRDHRLATRDKTFHRVKELVIESV